MRIRPISDLHIDFYKAGTAPWSDPSDDYDVLAVLGDISNPVMAGIEELAREVERSGKPCLFSPGNHCGYRGLAGSGWENTFWEEQMQLLEEFGAQNGIIVLNRKAVVIDGVRFVGCVGWPELASELVPPFMTRMEAMFAADRGWWENPFNRVGKHSDFSEVRVGAGNNRHRMTPKKMIEMSKADTAFLRDELAKPFGGDTTVVLTHVGPASLVQPGMHSWLYGSRSNEDLICSPDSGVSLWLSGHTHRTFDVEVGGVRCVSNARGYPNENPDFDPSLVIEVGHDLTPKLGM